MTTPTRDLATREDLETLIRTFYRRLFADEVMGPIFTDIAQMDLEAHIPTMCDFWENHLWQTGHYRGGMMAVHLRLDRLIPLEQHHFMRWMDAWEATVDELFVGPNAALLKMTASRVAGNMIRRFDEIHGRASGPMVSPIRWVPPRG